MMSGALLLEIVVEDGFVGAGTPGAGGMAEGGVTGGGSGNGQSQPAGQPGGGGGGQGVHGQVGM